MRTNPQSWSDEFDLVDDPEFTAYFDDDLDDSYFEEPSSESHLRRQSPWRELENRLGERQLRADLVDWDYWDDYLATH